MIELAFIELTRSDGRAVAFPIRDVKRIYPITGGAQITLTDGGILEVGESVDSIYSTINGKWTDWLTALGDPA